MKRSIALCSLLALSASLLACLGEATEGDGQGEAGTTDGAPPELADDLGSAAAAALAVAGGACGTHDAHCMGRVPTGALKLWLRANAGITQSAGKVSSWQDQSGNGNTATQTNAAAQPTLVSGALNGKPVIRFQGWHSLFLAEQLEPTRFTIFIVGKNSKTAEVFSMILGPGNTSPNNQIRWENGSQALFVGLGNDMPIITSTLGNTRVYHALSARYDGSTMTVYRDGELASSHDFTTTGPWILLQIGAWFSSYYMHGDLAEILVYESALSEGARGAVDGYLRSKYALP
ncbi:LamG-like jellyroll fold domain-containing protein [Sorangium sp. So ce1335]|uniref:LamG-like jellyroll fold domain-containing protein n=1 Tax=Sorangium sp. So ce1335 TaxID=3133335 RepID=UPI003F629F17